MSLGYIDRPGRYKAKIVSWGLDSTKESEIPVLALEFEATAFQEQSGGEWQDWSEYQLGTRGYFYPFKKDGSTNDKTIEQLMKCIGWDGTSLAGLQDGNYFGKEVQIVVAEDEWKGKKNLKVKWMDHIDFESSLRKADAAETKAMCSTWDSKLRAINGTSPSKPKSPPVAPPKAKAG